jgi:uncharacterized membrane protein YbhN (UPF0104 family)
MRWLLRAAVSIAVALILFALIPFGTVMQALRRVNGWTWVATVIITLGGHYLNALKLRLLLGWSTVPLSLCVRAQYAGLLASLGLPGAAGGDLVRGAYLARTVGVRRITLGSVADRLVDSVALLVLAAIALPIAGAPAPLVEMSHRRGWWLAGLSLGGLLLGLMISLPKDGVVIRKLSRVLAAFKARRTALSAGFVLALIVQSAFVLTNVWIARQVGVTIGLAAWFVAWPLSKLVSVLPISLGGLGVREAVLVALLAPYGAPREAVLASGILWQVVPITTGLTGFIVTQWLRRR